MDTAIATAPLQAAAQAIFWDWPDVASGTRRFCRFFDLSSTGADGGFRPASFCDTTSPHPLPALINPGIDIFFINYNKTITKQKLFWRK